MKPYPYQSSTLCRKCNQFIKTSHFLIHNQKCKGALSSPSRSMSNYRASNHLSNSRMKTQFQEQQRIPCHFCGYLQTFAELDSHPNTCQHRQQQCMRCHNRFPRSLMGQHQIVCPAGYQQQEDSYQQMEEYSPISPHTLIRRQSNPFQFMTRIMSQSSPLRRSRSERSNHSQFHHSHRPNGQRMIMINRMEDLIRLLAGELHGQTGLDKQEIKNFPVNKFVKKNRKQGEQDMCIICYCQFQQGQQCMTLPCKHIFHPQCVKTWLQKNPTCPVCKHKYSSKKRQQQDEQQEYSEGSRQRHIIFRF